MAKVTFSDSFIQLFYETMVDIGIEDGELHPSQRQEAIDALKATGSIKNEMEMDLPAPWLEFDVENPP